MNNENVVRGCPLNSVTSPDRGAQVAPRELRLNPQRDDGQAIRENGENKHVLAKHNVEKDRTE